MPASILRLLWQRQTNLRNLEILSEVRADRKPIDDFKDEDDGELLRSFIAGTEFPKLTSVSVMPVNSDSLLTASVALQKHEITELEVYGLSLIHI